MAARWAVVPVLCAVLVWVFLSRVLPRNTIPAHMLGHQVLVQENLIAPEIGAKLLDLAKKIGKEKGYPTNVADTNFYHTEHEHIGEAVKAKKVDDQVICENPFLVPSSDRTLCVLAGRIDIGRHLITTGGARGLRESYEKIISRVQSFGAYHFDVDTYPVVSQLFQDTKFRSAAQSVCPPGKQYLDPFQFNFIIQVPGQTVATHVDGVYFEGASRFQFPQWLLAAMQFSGLSPWAEDFIDQIQVVGYLHEWQPEAIGEATVDQDNFGSFIYWNSSSATPQRVLPKPLSGSVVDGSKVVHAASVYRMEANLPFIDKGIAHWLRRVDEDDRWTISNDRDGILQNYTLDDLRISIVYRARCFASAAKAKSYRQRLHGPDGQNGRYSLDEVLSTFVDDLIVRGKLPAKSTLNSIPRLELALKIMDEYIRYPLPANRIFPWNYCALGRIVPSLNGFLSLIC